MSTNLFKVASEYISRMIPEDGSMKVLLLDEDTLDVVSLAFSQTQLLKKGVFLVDRIDHPQSNTRGRMPTMRCCVFIRPSFKSIDALCREVKAARYTSYSIMFSNAVTTDSLDMVARADVENLVGTVEEYFCDWSIENEDLFLVRLSPASLVPALMPTSHFRRVAEGLAASFVALRRKPHIRFHKGSVFIQRVMNELVDIINGDPELYNFKAKDTVMIINDRSDDPITPLLTPWTYQAMLHELIELKGNRLRLPDAVKDEDEYCFSEHDDSFYAAHLFDNWGELCTSVKDYVDECKATLNIDKSTATMEEIKQFMQKLPQTKSMTSSVTKHATVVSHLSSVIKRRRLLDVSLLEQDMVSTTNASDHWTRLLELAHAHTVDRVDIVRLCIIYNFRYERFGDSSSAKTTELLQSADERLLLRKAREYFGDRSVAPLFATTGVMSSIVKTFSDVGNIYTQHEPALKKTLHALLSGKLDADQFPYAPTQQAPTQALYRPKEVVVFTCGGITYAEAALVRAVNKGTAFSTGSLVLPPAIAGDVKALIGGTSLLNSSLFLEQLQLHP